MIWFISSVFLCLTHSHLSQCQQDNALRVPATIVKSNGLTCPTMNFSAHKEAVRRSLQDYYTMSPPCSCGNTATGNWTRAVYLNMSDPNSECPPNWSLTTSPVRGCGRKSSSFAACDSVTYAVGHEYTNVCGRVEAIQKGVATAFVLYISGNFPLESAYLDGISLTHGLSSSRQHIWSFVGAYYEQDPSYRLDVTCPCTNTNVNWTHQVPPFVGMDYFCDTGNRGPGTDNSAYYTNDPLWDGQGCGTSSSCCNFNMPPWFCKTLPNTTSDDLELRNCYGNRQTEEDKIITMIEIYVK